MKNKMLLVLSVSCLMYFSCSKKNENSTPSQTVNATVNGTSFSAAGNSVGEATVTQGTATSYGFTATEGNSTLSLFLGSVSTGTYNFGISFSDASIQYFSGGANGKEYFSEKGIAPTNGSIIIASSASNIISGTFSGVLYALGSTTDSVVISNGTFNNLHY